MLTVKKIRLIAPPLHVSAIVDVLYDFILPLYIFSHTALGWNAGYAGLRRICTAAYIMVSFMLLGQAIYNRKVLITIRYTLVWGAGFLFFGFSSCLGSQELGVSLRNVIRISLNFFFMLALDYKVRDRAGLKKLLNSVVSGTVLAAMYVWISSGAGTNNGYGRLGHNDEIGNIVNLLSHMSAFAIVFNLYHILESFTHKKKAGLVLYTVLEIFLFYIVLRTGSRTGVIIVFTGIALALFLYTETSKKPFYILGGIAVCLAAYQWLSETALFQTLYKTSFENLVHFFTKGKSVGEISLGVRFEMILKGLELWRERPLFGWGIGTFSDLAGYNMYSHCDYVELLFGTGLIGALFFYSFLFFSLIRLFKMKKVRNAGVSIALSSGLAILVSNFSAVTYNSFLMMVYMLYIYKTVLFETENGLFRIHRYIV